MECLTIWEVVWHPAPTSAGIFALLDSHQSTPASSNSILFRIAALSNFEVGVLEKPAVGDHHTNNTKEDEHLIPPFSLTFALRLSVLNISSGTRQ